MEHPLAQEYRKHMESEWGKNASWKIINNHLEPKETIGGGGFFQRGGDVSKFNEINGKIYYEQSEIYPTWVYSFFVDIDKLKTQYDIARNEKCLSQIEWMQIKSGRRMTTIYGQSWDELTWHSKNFDIDLWYKNNIEHLLFIQKAKEVFMNIDEYITKIGTELKCRIK